MKYLLFRLLEVMNLTPVAVYLSLLIFSLLMFFSPSNDYILGRENFDSNTLKRIEDDTGLKFPSGTFGWNMYCKQANRLEPRYWAKIEIPEKSLKLIVEQIEQIQNGDEKFYFGIYDACPEKIEWWKPSKETLRMLRFYRKVIIWLCQEDEAWILYVWFNAR